MMALGRLVGRGWRLWLLSALLGAAVAAGGVLREPPRWASEGQALLRPRFILEGYLLATNELTRHYALRLEEEERVARVLRALDASAPNKVEASEAAGGIVHLRVVHRDPAQAEAIARALLADFRAELERENRSREEPDRLVVALSPSSFPRPVNREPGEAAAWGFGAGLVAGVLIVLLHGWLRRDRLSQPLEAEQLLGAPTLGAIPRR